MIFDFDGLILDTEWPEVRAWQLIFESHGCEFPDSWWIDAIGRGADQIMETPFELLARLKGRSVAHAEVQAVRDELYAQLLDQERPLPGVIEAIDAAKARGARLGVASSSKHEWVDAFLEKLGIISEFEAILCADDVPRAKPYPDLYLSAARVLGASPERAIALEDSPNGIRAAKAAGLFCIAVPNRLTARLDLSHADLVLESLSHLAWSD